MKNLLLSVVSSSIMIFTGVLANAQSATQVSATGKIYAEIISAFTATETSQLNFGRFSPGPFGGQIVLSPASTISVLGSVNKGAGSHNAASFYVSGDMDAAYTISLPTTPIVLKHTSDEKTMVVEGWESIPSQDNGAGMLHEGFQEVFVGATLKVGPLSFNPVGLYIGSYTITFDFN